MREAHVFCAWGLTIFSAFLAMDIAKPGTRREELLAQLREMYVLRRILNPTGPMEGIECLLDKLRQTKANSDFFDSMNK
jgi:transcription termination factor Rho